VELLNIGTSPVYVHNWTLDDGEEDEPIGKTAYKIQSPTILPGGVAIITIPIGKFTLKNTSGTLRLFDPDNILVGFVSYQGAKEGLSFALNDGEWGWGIPSPDSLNLKAVEINYSDEIVINELLPYPSAGSDEYIELKNNSAGDVNLKDWVLSDKSTSYKLPDLMIPSEGLIVIYKSDSKIALNNFGDETVTLKNPLGEIVDEVSFEDPPKGQSFSRVGEEYFWTKNLTPGVENSSGGKVAGLSIFARLPRTGNDRPLDPREAIVLWAVVWYIYVKLTKQKELNYEQTGTY
jgi:hypothetical protein